MSSSDQTLTVAQAIQLAQQYHNSGDFQQAESMYQQILQVEPNNFEVLHSLGILGAQVGNYVVAAELIEKAIQINKSIPTFYNSLGNVYRYQNKLAKAATTFQYALKLDTNNHNIYNNLGNVFRDQNQLNEAVDCYQRSLKLNPDFAEAHNNLGNVLRDLKQVSQAVDCYRRAIALNPDYVEAHNNLGFALAEQNKLDEAMACSQQALALNPNYAEAYNNIAIIWADRNNLDAAQENYQQALRLHPNYADAHFGYAMLLLKLGEFALGWSEYEWRLKRKRHPFKHFKHPIWDGSNLNGRRLLVYWEQGLGDAINFVRYLNLIKGGTVIFICQPELKCLFGESLDIKIIVDGSQDIEEIAHDVWIPLLSLPNIFTTTLDNIPTPIPNLNPNNEKVVEWQARLQTNDFMVGIAWAGNPKYPNDVNRSCPLHHFVSLAKLPNITYFALQKGTAAKQQIPEGMQLVELGKDLTDFNDTAAVIANLDLIISVDTAVAHLAGTMNKPVWILLPFIADWRWLLDRNDTPWYPSMRLFRQPRPQAWTDVFNQVVKELSAMLRDIHKITSATKGLVQESTPTKFM